MISLIMPVDNWRLILLPVTLVMGWTLWCRVPKRYLARVLLLAAGMFCPFLLLAPFTHYKTGISWLEAITIPLIIALRGTLCLVASMATYTTLDSTELGEALYNLPVPRIVSTLILQIVHQTAMLKNETFRMLAAYKLRGLTTSGFRMRTRCLCAFPVLWLIRLTMRAERVANAMELRGFTGPIHTRTEDETGFSDLLTRTIAFLMLLAAIILNISLKH